MQVELPYGKEKIQLDVPDENLLDVVLPKEYIAPDRPEVLIRRAILNPIGSERLSNIAAPGDRVAIVVDDHTRPCPTKDMLPPLLTELKRADVEDSDVLIIVATGSHKIPSFDIIKEIVGDKVSRNYTIIANDREHVHVGKTKMGHDVEILRDYVESDVKVILGDIEYHYFAGYVGTRRSILPGISSKKTIQQTHKLMFHENARAGVLKENPIHQEMNDALHLAGCDFALNVVLNSSRRVVGAWAGDCAAVLDAGIKLVDEMYRIKVKEKASIVITAANGYPHDIDLFQAYKALHSVLPVVEDNGIIILVAECSDGHGNEVYEAWMKNHRTSKEIKEKLMKSFVTGAHKAYYHLKAIEEHPVILVSRMDKDELKNVFRLIPTDDVNSALKRAFEIAGKKAMVRIVPQGTSVLLELSD
jgi:nickel-dependent lactate racemase